MVSNEVSIVLCREVHLPLNLVSRLATAVAQWLKVYPGDFADSQMQTAVYTLLEDAASMLPLAHILEDIAIGLAKVDGVSDPDASWSRPAGTRDRKTSLSALLMLPNPSSNSALSPISPGSYSDLDDSTLEAIASNLVLDGEGVLQGKEAITLDTPAEPASASTSDLSHITIAPSLPSSGQYSSQRESSDGSRSFSEPDLAESRAYARAIALFDELPDAAIAMELTLLEYEHFQSIRVGPHSSLCLVVLTWRSPATASGKYSATTSLALSSALFSTLTIYPLGESKRSQSPPRLIC